MRIYAIDKKSKFSKVKLLRIRFLNLVCNFLTEWSLKITVTTLINRKNGKTNNFIIWHFKLVDFSLGGAGPSNLQLCKIKNVMKDDFFGQNIVLILESVFTCSKVLILLTVQSNVDYSNLDYLINQNL